VAAYDRILENSLIYKLWQEPFVEKKLAPLHRDGAIRRARRVLDVGCGPGTNTSAFENADYLGIDVNPKYVEYARRRFSRDFVVADVTEYQLDGARKFDFILVNSLLHHIDADGARRLLRRLSALLSDDGHVHVLDMVLPKRRWSVSRFLARMDRGEFPRPLAELRALVDDALEIVDFRPNPLAIGQLMLWDFVYFKARARR
jgi:SAM-dependent methyltransferase